MNKFWFTVSSSDTFTCFRVNRKGTPPRSNMRFYCFHRNRQVSIFVSFEIFDLQSGPFANDFVINRPDNSPTAPWLVGQFVK